MTCASCVALIENRVKRVAGVGSIAVGLLSEQADVKYDPAQTDPEAIAAVIVEAGFTARPIDVAKENSVVLKIEGMTCASCVNTIEVSRSVDGNRPCSRGSGAMLSFSHTLLSLCRKPSPFVADPPRCPFIFLPQSKLRERPGITKASVGLTTSQGMFEYDPDLTGPRDIIEYAF